MTTSYTVPKDLFMLAFDTIDRHLLPATPVPNVGHVRGLLNALEACALDNETKAQSAAQAAQREQLLAELQAKQPTAAAAATAAAPEPAPAPT